MGKYFVTAFSHNGEKIINESFEAEGQNAAREKGLARLAEENALESTARIVESNGSWIYFHA